MDHQLTSAAVVSASLIALLFLVAFANARLEAGTGAPRSSPASVPVSSR